MSRADAMFGKKDVSALGGDGPLVSTPWNPAGGRKDLQPYREDLVHDAIRNNQPTEPVDPRHLVSTQDHLVRHTVRKYIADPNTVQNDKHQAGNQRPVVYDRNGTHMILSGHHRAAAALLRGEQFHAVVVHGGFGPER